MKRGINDKESVSMGKWKCVLCGYMYESEDGDPESEIEPGTAFEELPNDWVCPVCGASRDQFGKVQ